MHKSILREGSANSQEAVALRRAFDAVVYDIGRARKVDDASRIEIAKCVIKAAKNAPICQRSGALDHRAVAIETAYQFLRTRRAEE